MDYPARLHYQSEKGILSCILNFRDQFAHRIPWEAVIPPGRGLACAAQAPKGRPGGDGQNESDNLGLLGAC
jgi:hypothetical protein